ncbi:hypothetical protein [Methanobacterium oryzae]|uniref:hypothetical protein n=1 Tax=Methanobacterium oryzae TaxID=69540 RepID=UPI003D1CC4FD
MDDKGLIFTIDAALALIPIFIVLTTIASLGDDYLTFSSQQIRISHDAQDTLETMATYKQGTDSICVLQNITETLMINKNNATGRTLAGTIASKYLNSTIRDAKYNLTEIKQLNTTIASNANMASANNTAVGVRNFGDYTFRLYIWN